MSKDAGVVFFDVGGTLVERVRDERSTTVQALRHTVGDSDDASEARALVAMGRVYHAGCYLPSTHGGERGLWRATAAAGLAQLPCGCPSDLVDRLADRLADYAPDYRVMPGMDVVLSRLRATGRDVGIISNWLPSLPWFLERLRIGPFAVVACSGTLRCTKPDPAIFQWAAARAGIALEDAWLVGNDPGCDYVPARSLGMRAVLWDPGGRLVGSSVCRVGSGSELVALLDA